MNSFFPFRVRCVGKPRYAGWDLASTLGLAGLLLTGLVTSVQSAQPAPAPAPKAAPAAEKPATKPAEKPATKPAEKPATKPAEKPGTPAAKGKGKEAEKEEKKPPPAEVHWLETKDSWRIHCVYLPPMEIAGRKGDGVVPVIMLHGWQGQGSEYAPLALFLQSNGHAIAIPDLRGHGRSTSRRKPDGDFETIKCDDTKFTSRELSLMGNDVEAVKKFLLQKNNDQELNIEMLTVVGAELGTAVALNWAVQDWSWPQTPAYKQGQDVKALVLLSPRQQFPKGVTVTQALASPVITRTLSIAIAVGEKDPQANSEARRVYGRIEKARPKLPKDPAEALRKQDLFLFSAPTQMQGTKLLDRNLVISSRIAAFLDLRLVKKREDYLWSDRKSPVGGG